MFVVKPKTIFLVKTFLNMLYFLTTIFLLFRRSFDPKMNFEQPPPYPGNGPTAPGYPAQGPPPQGYPPQGYPPQGYPVNMEQPNPAYPNYPAGPMGPGGPYPGPGQPAYQGYPGQPQFGWQGGPPPGPMYGEAPKNTGEWYHTTEIDADMYSIHSGVRTEWLEDH